jgi:DNA-binding GntR family transcriptional regulator
MHRMPLQYPIWSTRLALAYSRAVDESALSTKADDIALSLEEAIVTGEIAPGAILRQEKLSEQFGVSRTPIREALRRLSALGLVSFVPNRGVRVRTLDRDDLREAFLVRAELESLATELAAPRITEEQLAELEATEIRFSELTLALRRGERDPGLTGEWMRANHAFHDVIYTAAKAPLVERLAKSARRAFMGQAAWGAGSNIDELYVRNDLEHRAIRHALAARNPEGARVLARAHVLHSGDLLLAILEQMAPRRDLRATGGAA